MIECVAVNDRRDLLGAIVISRRGRDKGKPGVICGWTDGDFALVSDGSRRTANNPKKKNMKHLLFTNCRPKRIHDVLNNGEQVADILIREELAAFGGRAGEGRPHG